MNFHKMVDNTFARLVDNANQIGDHFARSNTDRDKVRLRCDDARRELAEVLAPFPIDLEMRAVLDAVDRALDVIEESSAGRV